MIGQALLASGRRQPQTLHNYVAMARPGHWTKNAFIVPGMALALVLRGQPLDVATLVHLVLAFIATCAIASANYTINEWLDARFDCFHPLKCNRPSAVGQTIAPLVMLQWLILALIGLTLATALGHLFLLSSLALLAMGVVYNVEPLRTKDRPYLDVLSEAVNNPLRFMLGWAAVVDHVLPPSSILLAYWMGGAYLMAVKRYAEYRYIDNPAIAGSYRRSFRFYSENSLLLSAMFYALSAAFFLGVFLIKYRIEFLLAMPFLAGLFVWYLHIGMRAESVAQAPEKLYRERTFLTYVVAVCLLIAFLFVYDMPWLSVLVEYHALRQ
jgi:decaprenyl-phosphate phosphoribosyltransferase